MKLIAPLSAIAFALPLTSQAQNFGGHFLENWDLNQDGAVTLAEVEERRGDLFYMFDSDENGLLTAEEYINFDETRAADRESHMDGAGQAKNMGKGIDLVQGAMTLDFNDTDADGAVSRDEFVANTARWFESMDTSGNGIINASDFGRK